MIGNTTTLSFFLGLCVCVCVCVCVNFPERCSAEAASAASACAASGSSGKTSYSSLSSKPLTRVCFTAPGDAGPCGLLHSERGWSTDSTEPFPVQSSISSPTALDHIYPDGLCSVVLWTADASSVPHGDGEHKLDSGALWPSVLMDVGIEFGGKNQHCGMWQGVPLPVAKKTKQTIHRMPRGLVAAVQDCSTNGLEAAGGHTVVLDAGWASIQAVAEPEAPALPSPPCQNI